MTQVLAAVPTTGLDSVLVAVDLVLESGGLSPDHILNVLARLTFSSTITRRLKYLTAKKFLLKTTAAPFAWNL